MNKTETEHSIYGAVCLHGNLEMFYMFQGCFSKINLSKMMPSWPAIHVSRNGVVSGK